MSLRIHTSILAVLMFCLPQLALAATLSVSPATVSVQAGDTITESILVTSTDQAANAISGTISFPSNLLSVTSVSKANSVLTLWVQDPSYSNSDGTVNFSGVVPNPGYIGTGGRVFTIQFVAKKAGDGAISFSSSAVLANDGSGTNILTGTRSGAVSVTDAPPVPARNPAPDAALLATITSSTHPDQTKAYAATHVVLDWTNEQGVTAVRIGYDKNKDGAGVVVYNDPLSHKEIDLKDGVWYFHVSEKGKNGWGPVATFKIHIDTSLLPEVSAPVATTTPATTTPVLSASNEQNKFAWLNFNTLSLALLLIVIALLIAWILYLMRRLRGSRKGFRPNLTHTYSLLHQEFGGLRNAVSSEILKLEHTHTKRELNKEEEFFAEKLQKMLDKAEKTIEKEIEKVSK